MCVSAARAPFLSSAPAEGNAVLLALQPEDRVERLAKANFGAMPCRALHPEGLHPVGAPSPSAVNQLHAYPPTEEEHLLSAVLEEDLQLSDGEEEDPVRLITTL